MKRSPALVSQILRVESAMQRRGLVPFVHAMPASSKILLSLYQLHSPVGSPYPLIRPAYDPQRKSLASIAVPQKTERMPRSDLLSVSYALTCNIVPLESAASWGFVNHFGKEQYFPMLNLFYDLMRGAPSSLVSRGRSLIRQYNRLQVGDFYMLGVPLPNLSNWMYDAKPFYVPTGRDIRNVAANPQVTSKEGTIATLKLAKEVLEPASGLVVVPASAADAYCKGLDLVSPRDIPAYQDILGPEESAFERSEQEKRAQLDAQLTEWIDDLSAWEKTGREPTGQLSKDAWDLSDFVPALP